MKRRLLVAGMGCMLLGGCAAVSPVQVGQMAGTVVGAAAIPGVGAPAGALLGTLLGMVFQKRADEITATRERQELTEQLDEQTVAASPSIGEAAPLQGEPKRVWVDEAVTDGKVLSGHYETRPVGIP